MNINLSRKNYYLFIFVYSLISILVALYIENILQYKACKLCLYQRIPYILAIFISFLGYNYFKNDKILILIIIVFAMSFILSGYHYGIENNIFKEFTGCSNNSINITNKTELLQSLKNSTPSCKDVNFKFLGISLAGINLILSLFIVIYSLKTLVYEKN